MKGHVLITGATKGIGRACAMRFAQAGWSVTAVARTTEDLQQMQRVWAKNYPNSVLHTHAADLSDAKGVSSVPQGDYDVLLLNAAAFAPGQLLDEADLYTAMHQLNVLANHRLARRLLPGFVARQRGHLVVIGSTGTDHWKKYMTAYVATKYALRGLYLGWEAELAGSGVLTTLVAPGATLTASWENETPPPDILQPEEVAEVVFSAVTNQRTGRLLV
ncbi:SDR family NAD(P)-dependent oxidoreductase [Neolewinella agarilytica]|uniref:Short-chain dehydrogenase n=1 Tax=Neolewinella agarilytica TaxID=478744 RepID=A0A1H9M1J8_9BACT|nr:SDR family NAD(P)-dependent oxidoreductase [Neolewinella agarilytica]SER17357.1 Short-chain dehydrogenase [Neolewinella agarilytica]